jgi:hypothetical protein
MESPRLRLRSSSLWAAVLLAAAGCGNGARSSLIRTDPIAAGAQCQAGGIVVRSGVDRNGDGMLEDDEVASTSYLCNGAGGSSAPEPATVVRIVPEPPGGHCKDGGSAIEAGIDANGNGVLDDGEVATTSYVCSGASGALVRIIAEPAGPHCLRGGSAIASGVDTNRDGILEDNEITTTSYVCNPVPTTLADVVINTAADVTQLTDVPRIEGNLVVQAPDLTELELPSLVTIGGDLRITKAATALKTVRLAALTTIGGGLHVGEQFSLTSVPIDELTAPLLRRVAELTIDSGKLSTFHLDALTTVDGALDIRSSSLTAVPPFPALSRAGSVQIGFNSSMTAVQLPKSLAEVDGTVEVVGNSVATSVAFSLAAIHGDAKVWLNDKLDWIDFGGRVDGTLDVEQNKLLTNIYQFPVGALSIKIQQNDALPSLYFNLTDGAVGDVTISYNKSLTQIGDFYGLRSVHLLWIENNAVLNKLSLPYLQVAEQIMVLDNSKLPQCLQTKLAAQLLQPAITEWSGNDTTATCN